MSSSCCLERLLRCSARMGGPLPPSIAFVSTIVRLAVQSAWAYTVIRNFMIQGWSDRTVSGRSTTPVATALEELVTFLQAFGPLRQLHSAEQDMDQVAYGARELAKALDDISNPLNAAQPGAGAVTSQAPLAWERSSNAIPHLRDRKRVFSAEALK
jgi:hypothetical protein